MFTNWKQPPQQMIRNQLMGDMPSMGGQQPMLPQAGTAGPMPGMPQGMQMPMQGNMMGRQMPMPGQNPIMPPRQIMPGNFAGTNGAGLMGYRPGR